MLFCLFFLFSLSFLWIPCIRARPPLSPSFHPHSWLSDFRSVHVGRSQFSRCCYLIIDLGSRLSMEAWPGLSRSHLISAVELGCLDLFLSSFLVCSFSLYFKPQRASLCGYCAVVRTLLHSPTTDAGVPPTFWLPQLQLVSWHSSLRAPQVAVPIAADHYLPQRVPEYSVPLAPASFSNSGLPPC